VVPACGNAGSSQSAPDDVIYAVVPCDAAQYSLRAVDCTLPALTACSTFSVYLFNHLFTYLFIKPAKLCLDVMTWTRNILVYLLVYLFTYLMITG